MHDFEKGALRGVVIGLLYGVVLASYVWSAWIGA